MNKDKNEFMRFKSIKLFVITVVMIPLLWSCEFLDYNELDQYEKKDIFFEFSRVKTVLTNVYSYLPTGFNGLSDADGSRTGIDGAMRASASDEAEDVWDVSDIQKFNDGSWNSTVTLDDNWVNMYLGIRSANVFLKEVEGLTFPEIQYNSDYPLLKVQFAVYPYEARFLRAFYYFELIKRYGSVPLITTVLTQDEANKVSKSSFNDIVTFIVAECDAAIPNLPITYATPTFNSGETGRATRATAMALKARVLLYAASPLNNPSNDQTKWIAAAKASKDIIDQFAATYTPLPVYTVLLNNITSTNKELIFERREAASRTFELANTAIGFIGGSTGTCPSQNLVDAYEVKVNATTSVPFDWANAVHKANPYNPAGTLGRDPRLAMTVLYNGSVWKTPLVVETWFGGLNAPPKQNATKTGYYLKKGMIEGTSLNPTNPGTGNHYWVIFRYGEVLLNYAEAMNEAYGPEVLGAAPLNNLTALAAVNIIRARTGVAMPGFPTGMSQSAFRDRLKNERFVELAFEDHRFWDIRRWKMGSTTKDIYGVDVTKAGTVYTYTKKLVESRFWDDRMYFYPIPQTELFINSNLLPQNAGWN